MKTEVVSASRDGAIAAAVEKLSSGLLVAVPTETVYGLAADALNSDAVQQIYAVKGRPDYNPLICHVANKDMARQYVAVPRAAEDLMDAFWPGPLSLVLPILPSAGVAPEVTAGLRTLAVRCPDNDCTRQVIDALGAPVAAPSANLSGKISPTRAQDVLNDLSGKISMILDDGPTSVGIESTIVSVSDEAVILLRPGSVGIDEISKTANLPVRDRDETIISAPGQLKSHYAPESAVLLNQTNRPDKNKFAFIGFGEIDGDMNLSASADLEEAARNLFAYLRKADNVGHTIAVAPIPDVGIGIAINDRLRRAAAPRHTEVDEVKS